MYKNLVLCLLLLGLMNGCFEQVHYEYEEDTSAGDLGIHGVLPVIGQIYIDNVEVIAETDGADNEMTKYHQKYILSSDVTVDNMDMLTGGKCQWEVKSGSAFFTGNVSLVESALLYNDYTTSYECSNVEVELKQDGLSSNIEPDSIITVKYKDKNNKYIIQTTIGAASPYTAEITLNVSDRHNIKDITTSPQTSLFWRKDGLFQAGFTAYRGMLGLQQIIGSALYEARVKAPGGTTEVSPSKDIADYDAEVIKDIKTMKAWVDNGTVNEALGIYSPSAFVSSYGPPVALPAFRKGHINYNRLRAVTLSHNNYPVILSDDKKLYAMGAVTNFDKDGSGTELEGIYRRQIRKNDIWFSYSGVDIKSNPDLEKFHTGIINPVNSTDAKFIKIINTANDLDTTIALNENDKEYYISGNPNYNNSFCSNKVDKVLFTSYIVDDENNIVSFDYNKPCGSYDGVSGVGAVKIAGLQKLIGDGSTAVASDSRIYYIGRDGKGYMVDLRPESKNSTRIKQGLPVRSESIKVPHSQAEHNHSEYDWKNNLYVVDIGYANINHIITPTLLLKDGSVVFMMRQYKNGNVEFVSRHFYINKDTSINQPNHKDNIKIIKLLGPTSGYGENGKIYVWTDISSLGISYKPAYSQIDDDYLAFVYGDPVQLLSLFQTEEDKQAFFNFTYSSIDIDNITSRFNNQSLGSNMVFMPYNPSTALIEEILENTGGENQDYHLKAIPYKPFRTNTFVFANLNNNADYSYIAVPNYFYGFDSSSRTSRLSIIHKKDGVMASEVKGGNISKVYGTYKTDDVPFTYSKFGKNTIFFANKKGIFSFVDYNARKTKSRCQDTGSCALDTAVKFDTVFPDYYYSAKSVKYLEESSGKTNYISTPFVTEIRMSNFPDISSFETKGFEPQLLSSYFVYEYNRTPVLPGSNKSSETMLAGYIPQFWFNVVKSRFPQSLALMTDKEFLLDFYQYAYGIGLYRYYTTDSYPVWRARKTDTEVLQYQTRFATLIPFTSGPAYESYAKNFIHLFANIPNIDKPDLNKYVAPREYVSSVYANYDKDLFVKGGDLSSNFFGNIETPMSDTDLRNSGIGYVVDKGNYMWKDTPVDFQGTGSIALDNFTFVLYH